MRLYLFIFFSILTIPLQGQTYTWTGAEEDSDFFNELNMAEEVGINLTFHWNLNVI